MPRHRDSRDLSRETFSQHLVRNLKGAGNEGQVAFWFPGRALRLAVSPPVLGTGLAASTADYDVTMHCDLSIAPLIAPSDSSRPSVPASLEIDLAAELAVDEDHVRDSQRHPEGPPGQADGESVVAGDCAEKGDVPIGAGGGG